MWARHCACGSELTTALCAGVLPLSPVAHWAWEEARVLTVQSIDSAGDVCGEPVVPSWVKAKGRRGRRDGGREWDREQASRTKLSCFHCSCNHWLQEEKLHGKKNYNLLYFNFS